MSGCLSGKRILVVEDEYFIASDLKNALCGEEAIVIGPAADLERGLTLLEEAVPDAAILDVNLEGSDSYPIAKLLAERGIPFLFLTGYDSWSLPEPYRAYPRLAKPFSIEVALEQVAGLLGLEFAA
jgi:DNA-binding NarL/FixJ family response regulator